MYCPVNNPTFDKLLQTHGENTSARLWAALGNKIENDELVQQYLNEFKSQEYLVSQLNQQSKVETIIDKLSNNDIEPYGDSYRLKSSEEIVSKRVSDYVTTYRREVQKVVYDNDDLFFAQKGTILHEYFNIIMESLISGKVPDYKESIQKVFNNLKTKKDFKDKDNIAFYSLTENQFNEVLKGIRGLREQIKEMQKNIDPKGKVKIFTEIPVYDHIYKDAGTVDLLVIFSDGSAGIFDYKSYMGKPGKEPSARKIDTWMIQLKNYKRMLKNVYGISEFRFSRILPIQTNYSKKIGNEFQIQQDGFKSLSIQNESNINATQHLSPIPIEEYTGQKDFDELLRFMYSKLEEANQQVSNLADNKNDEYYKALRNVTRYQKSLKDLQLYKDLNSVLDLIRSTYVSAQNRIKLDDTNPNSLSISEIDNYLRELEMYRNIGSALFKNIKHKSEEEKQKLFLKQGQVNATLSDVIEQLNQKLLERLSPDILKSDYVPGQLGRVFQGIGNYNMPIFRDLARYFRYANERSRRETMQDIELIRKKDKAFTDWAKKNGYSDINKFDIIYDSNTGKLKQKYSKNFWERRSEIYKKLNSKESLNKEDISFIRDNFKFNKSLYEKDLKKFEDSIQSQLLDGIINKEEANKRKLEWLNARREFDNQGNFLLSRSSLFYYEAVSNDDKYITPEWKVITSNKEVKDYYDMYLSYNEKYTEVFGNRIGRHFVANVQQSLLDRLTEMGLESFKDMEAVLERTYALRENDELFGSVDLATGEFKKSIPLLFADAIRKPLNNSQIEQIEKEVETLFDRNTENFKSEVNTRIKNKEYELGRTIKSKDLTKSLMLFVNSANEHINMMQVEEFTKGVNYLIDSKQIEKQSLTNDQQTLVNKFTNTIISKVGIPTDLKEVFEEYSDRLVYKRQFKQDYRVFDKYSGAKIVRSLMNYLSIKALGLNLVVTSANFIQARTGLYMKSKENIHFGDIELRDTVESFKPSSLKNEKWNMLINYFEPTTRDRVTEEIDMSAATFTGRNLTQRTVFLGHILGDDNVDNTLLVAMSKRYVVDSDGKIKNPKVTKLLNPEAKTVFDSIQNIDGKPEIIGLSLEAAADFRAKVQKVSSQVKGMTNEELKGLYGSNLVLQTMMQFRTWMPGLFEERFGKFRYDPTLETIEQGRFRVAMGEIIGNGILPSITQLLKYGTEVVMIDRLLGTGIDINANQNTVEHEIQKFLQQHPEMVQKYNTPELKKELINKIAVMKRAKLNAFVAESRVYLSLFVLFQLLGGLEWDDEEEGNIFSWQSHQIARRALLEVSFWFSPSSVTEIVKSPLPLMGVATDFGKMLGNAVIETSYLYKDERDARDKTPPFYYLLKNTPLVNQALGITGFFNTPQTQKSIISRVIDDGDDK